MKESERVSTGAAKAANVPIYRRVADPEAGRQQLTDGPAQQLGRPVPAAALAAQVSAARKSRRGRLSELRNPWAG